MENALRIVQVINSIVPGGAERLAADLHTEYRKLGHDSHLVAIVGPSPTENLDGLWCAGSPSVHHPSVSALLTGLLKHPLLRGASVVHVHLFPALYRTPAALRRAGWKGMLVASEHSTYNRRRGTLRGRLIDSLTYRHYKRIICVSDAVRDALVKWRPKLVSRSVVVNNGIRLEEYLTSPERLTSHAPPVILSIGRLTEAKNYTRAITAVADLNCRMDREFVYRIVGDGPHRGKLEKLVEESGLVNRVLLPGSSEDIPHLLREADVLFIPSLWEGFGIAAVEAMAAGLPVVAGDVPGLRDVVGTRAGILVDPYSISGMSRALERVLTDRELYRRLASAGPERASAYSIRECALRHLEIYECAER